MTYLITNQNNFGNVPYPCPSYPKATVKSGGCGACAVLNCVENMTALRFQMVDWIAYVRKNGGRIDGGTSIANIMKALRRDYSFDFEQTNDLTKVKNHLKSGGFAVFHGGYGNVFSSAGHFVCLCGINDSGKAMVLDSGWYRGKYNTSSRRNKVHEWGQNGLLSVPWQYVEADKKFEQNQGTNYYLLKASIEKKDEDDMKYFETMNEVPNFGKETVKKLMERKLLQGTQDGKLHISEDMLRILVINDRAGLYH